MSPRTQKILSYAVAVAASLLAVGTVNAATVSATTAPTGHIHVAARSAPSEDTGRPLPDRVGTPAYVKQLITVTSRGWSTTRASLRAWQKDADGHWRLARGP